MKEVSEKTLELNVGAEILNYYRIRCGLPKMYLRGLTQQQESVDGVDFFAKLPSNVRIAAFQFKAPHENANECCPYNFTIQEKQHTNLRKLAKIDKKSVFYVLPFYSSNRKLQKYVPNLLQDTWFLQVNSMETSSVFGGNKSKTVRCDTRKAYINPEFDLFNLWEFDLRDEAGIPLQEFITWYRSSLPPTESHYDMEPSTLGRKNPWLFRGLKIAIIADHIRPD